jgi:hypothetical protein
MSEIVKVEDLSAEARTALINFGGSRQGQHMPQGLPENVRLELYRHNLISVVGNLTRWGGIVRDRCVDAALDAL